MFLPVLRNCEVGCLVVNYKDRFHREHLPVDTLWNFSPVMCVYTYRG